MQEEEKLREIQFIKFIINDFINKYYNEDVVKIEIHKNKSMGTNLSFKVFPMNSIERF